MKEGKVNILKVVEVSNKGYYLSDSGEKTVFLPQEKDMGPFVKGQEVEVFNYTNPKFVLTAKIPRVTLEEFGFLKVTRLSDQGVWVDWGLEEELFVPDEELVQDLVVGDYCLVFVYKDEATNKFLGSQRVDDFVFFDEIDLKKEDQVNLLPYRETPLGVNAIVNNLHKGLIFKSDIHKPISIGEKIKGYVKQVRDDGNIDLVLEPIGYRGSISSATQTILDRIQDEGGYMALNDKSDPIIIKEQLGLSKKAFKRAVGSLYKQKKIEFYQDGIRLTQKAKS